MSVRSSTGWWCWIWISCGGLAVQAFFSVAQGIFTVAKHQVLRFIMSCLRICGTKNRVFLHLAATSIIVDPWNYFYNCNYQSSKLKKFVFRLVTCLNSKLYLTLDWAMQKFGCVWLRIAPKLYLLRTFDILSYVLLTIDIWAAFVVELCAQCVTVIFAIPASSFQ